MGITSEKRRHDVLAALTVDGGIKVSELARRFDVSMETIRKDMKYWEKVDVLKRTHGGAILKSDATALRHIDERLVGNIDAKNAIAVRAVDFVPEGGTVFLDAGSTTVCLAKHLNIMSGLTILTNSVLAASMLSDAKNHIMVIGGILRGGILGTHGAWASMALRTILIDVAFLDCSGVKGFDGPVANDLNDIEFKRAVIERAKTKIVLADSSKLLGSGKMSYCNWEEINGLVTNVDADRKQLEKIKKHTKVILA